MPSFLYYRIPNIFCFALCLSLFSSNSSQVITERLRPTTNPTQSPIQALIPEDWYVGPASVVLENDGNNTEMKIRHDVGAGADSIMVHILKYDCITPVRFGDVFSSVTYDTVLSSGVAEYTIQFDLQYLSEGDLFAFCTKLELIDDELNLSVSSRKERFSVDLDASVDFSSTDVKIEYIGPLLNEWIVGTASVLFDVKRENVQLKISHEVGAGVDSIVVKLFHFDCITPVGIGDAMYLVTSDTILASGFANYTVEFDMETLSTSSAMVDNGIALCTKLEVFDGNIDQAISFRKQRFSFALDTSTDFIVVDMNTAESDIDDFNLGSLKFYRVTSCQCHTSFECDPPPGVTLESSSAFSICIIKSSPGVEFRDFDLTITGNEGFSYSPITMGENGQELHFGTSIKTEGLVTRITTRVVTGLFDEGSDKITIEGVGILGFPQRRLTIDETEYREFTLDISLQSRRILKCWGSIVSRIRNVLQFS